MKVLPICHYPEEAVLRKIASKVPRIDGRVLRLIDDMMLTMRRANGVGLAAPQVGVSLRVIVVQVPGDKTIALINPEIEDRTGEQVVTEGCLSIPGYYGELKRPAELTVKGKDFRGKRLRYKATGLMAEAFEHEVDHLNGVLYIDRIENPEKLHKIKCQDKEG